jgi:hypothetical protein
MFHHTVMMQISPQADARFHAEVDAFCARLSAECEGLRSIRFVSNVSDRSNGFNHAVVADFDSAEAHDLYQTAPAHLAFKAFIMPSVQSLAVLDYQTA